jgi:hypothetical protein
MPVLVAARLLKPLDNPPPDSVKFFAESILLEKVEDRTWLAKVTNALHRHRQKRNAAKKNFPVNSQLMATAGDKNDQENSSIGDR